MKKENESVNITEYKEGKDRVFAELGRRHPELAEAAIRLEFKKKRRKKLIAAFTSIGAAAACLAIVLPLTLTRGDAPATPVVPEIPVNNNTETDVAPEIPTPPVENTTVPETPTPTPAPPTNRFCAEDDYMVEPIYTSIKDFNAANNTSMLYLSDSDTYFYNSSYHYILKENDEVIMVKDTYDTEEFSLFICVTDCRTELSETKEISNGCNSENKLNDITVFNAFNSDNGYKGYFEYKDYKYYISTDGCFEQSDFFAIVENMLLSQSAL